MSGLLHGKRNDMERNEEEGNEEKSYEREREIRGESGCLRCIRKDMGRAWGHSGVMMKVYLECLSWVLAGWCKAAHTLSIYR